MQKKQLSFEDRKNAAEQKVGHIKNKIMVMSGKGGVGKSTVAVNLSFALAMKGKNTGIVDADIHGPNVPKMLGLEDVKLEADDSGITPAKIKVGGRMELEVMSLAFMLEKDSPVIWKGPIKMSLLSQFLSDVKWSTDRDYLIFDLPPGTGDEPLDIIQLIPDIRGSIIVTTPQDVALMDARRSVEFSKKLNVPVIGIIENMSGLICPHCKKEINLFKKGGGENAAKELGVPFLGRIPLEPELVRDADKGKPFILSHYDSPAGKAFNEIVEKIIKQ